MRVRWLAVAAVGVLSLAVACGNDPGPSGAGQSGSPEATATSAGDDAERPTTITAALAARNAELAENRLVVEAAVQACMTAQGFEYTPSASGGDVFVGAVDGGDFVEQFGYGVSTLTGGPLPDLGLGAGASEDPNQAYVQSLSDSQRDAYYEALHGVAPDGPSFTGDDSSSSGGGPSVTEGTSGGFVFGGSGGCTAEANLEVYGEEQPLAFGADLFDGLQEISAQVDADPRMLTAWESWASCMADAGYPFADEDEIVRDLGARFTAITGQDSPRASGGFAIITDEAADPAEPDYDVVALEALQDEEREIAALGQGCREDHVDDVESEVRDELERSYLKDNPGLLDQLLGPASGS